MSNSDVHWEQFKIAVAEILRARLERMAQDAEAKPVVLNPQPVKVAHMTPVRARRTVRKGGDVDLQDNPVHTMKQAA